MQPLEQSAIRTQGKAHAKPVKRLKRIGSATVEITVNFISTSNKTMTDITSRLFSCTAMGGEFEKKQSTKANMSHFAPAGREVNKSA